MPAGPTIGSRIVAARGFSVINSQIKPTLNNFGFGQINQRRMDRQLAALYSGHGGQVGHFFIGLNKFRAAVGIAAVIQRIHADKDIIRFQHFRPSERIGEEHGVSGRNVGHRNFFS